ncbi:MAG: hydroxymethylpyrimidine/phosphomethylpyrimidine kinase [Clostridia bacterium]|nr:hydroxymethylpyrimidine/phosphomethylpyrimidine kinase [Clostridia bacterium]
MKSILIVSNSIEYADFDIRNDVDTVSFCEMAPVVVAPVIQNRDSEPIICEDVTEAMEYCFKESYPSAICIGYLNDGDIIFKVMDDLDEHPSVPCVMYPKFITDDGDLMVSEDIYNELVTKILPRVKLVVINSLEAELIAGFTCTDESTFKRAMKKVYNLSGCSVLIKPSDICPQFMFFDGRQFCNFKSEEFRLSGFDFSETSFSLGTACACALGSGATMYDAVCAGIEVFIEGSASARRLKVVEKPDMRTAEKVTVKVEEKAPSVVVSDESTVNEAVSTSLVSPVKSLRDRARSLEEKYSSVAGGSNASSDEESDEHKRGVVLDLMQAAASEKEKQEIEEQKKEKEVENDALNRIHNLRNRLSNM